VRREIEKKLWSIFVAVAVGMSLLFMWASSYPFTIKVLGGLAGLGFVLLQFALRRKFANQRARTEILVDQTVIVLDAQGSNEIFLAPNEAVINPRLVIAVLGGRVIVEDAWHAGVSVLPRPTPVSRWQLGVTYSGVLDYQRPLKLLIRNESSRPATVRARVFVKRRRTC
jgi:hypothetical protein